MTRAATIERARASHYEEPAGGGEPDDDTGWSPARLAWLGIELHWLPSAEQLEHRGQS